MRNWFVVFTAVVFLGMSSYLSAGEFLSSALGKSVFESAFEQIQMESETDFSFVSPHVNAARFHLACLPAQTPGGVDDAANSPTTFSGRIYGARQYVELTPMWGYTFGGQFKDEENDETIKISDAASFGLRLAYDYERYAQIEFLYSHQKTEMTAGDLFPQDALFDLDVDYYHIGGSLLWDRGKWQPYFTGTVGLTHLNPEDSAADSLTRFSMDFGGGARYFPTERLGLYLGARAWLTLVNSEIEAYSGSKGSYVKIESDALWQFQLFFGLIVVF